MADAFHEPEQRYRLLLLNADIAAQTHDGDKALRLLDQLKVEELPLALQAGYFGIKGEAHFRLGQYDEARLALQKALQIHRQPELDSASPLQIAQLRNLLAGTYYQQNQHQKALDLHKLCLQAVLDGYINETRFKLKLFNNLGNEHLLLGQVKPALEYYQQAVALAVAGEDDIDRAIAFWGTGITYRQLENYHEAENYLVKALKLYRKAKAWNYIPGVRNTLGWVLISLEKYDAAREELQKGLAEATKKTKNRHDQSLLNLNLAYLYFKQGENEAAEDYALKALALAQEVANKQTLGLILAQLAEIKMIRGEEVDEVRQLFEKALENLKQTDSKEFTRRVYKRYAEVLRKAGLLEEALDVLNKAFEYFDEG